MTHQHQSPSQPLSEEEQALAAGYVLGDLTDEEQQQMVALLKRSEVQQEVNALRVSWRSLPQSLPPVAPPPSIEAKILTAYETTHATQANASTPHRPIAPSPHPSPPSAKIQNPPTLSPSQEGDRTIQNPKFPVSWSNVIAGLATLVALFLGANNAHLRNKLAEDPSDSRMVQILQQPNSRLVSLQGRDETNTAMAGGTLLFQKGQWQEVVVSLNNLPPLPAEQVYRMWLTLEDGSALFCGEFNTREDGTISRTLTPQKMPPKGVKAIGLFVTQDTRSAPLSPTGTQLMVGEI